MILGHAHPAVVAAVQAAVSMGQLFAGQNPLEAEFAEALGRRPAVGGEHPDRLDRHRDGSARGPDRRPRQAPAEWCGSSVTTTAGSTRCSSTATATPEPFGAVPLTAGQSVAAASDVLVCEWNDLDQVARALAMGDVACVVMEPVMCNTGLIAPAPGYLEGVKALCARHGALLVIDEVITGFRLGLTGAQGRLGVHGDISIYAKAIASGFPLAVLGTTTDLLAPVGRGEVNHSGTYNTGALVAGRRGGHAAVPDRHRSVSRDGTTHPAPHRRTRGGRSPRGRRARRRPRRRVAAADPLRRRPTDAFAPDFAANSDRLLLARFLELLQDLGVRPTSRGLWFVSSAHDDALVDRTLAAVAEALTRL